MNLKEKICEKCKQPFKPTSSTQVWCQKCLEKPCENCGGIFRVRNRSKFQKSRFCSVECKREFLSKTMVGENAPNYRGGSRLKVAAICDNCGKEFMKDATQLQKWDHHFCCRKCQTEFYRQPENKITGESSPVYSRIHVTCEWCKKDFTTYQSTASKVRFCSMECRNNWQSDMMKGDKHPLWNGGSSEKRHLDMSSREYKQWRLAVFTRDDFTCQVCGDCRGGNLRAHHIKRYSYFPELRHVVDNGITLCESCHTKVHSQLDIQSDPQYNQLMKLRRLAEMTSPAAQECGE